MAELSLKNLFGDARATIEAIQKYIKNNEPVSNFNMEEDPAASVNRILDSVACEETNAEIRKIINNL